MKTTIKFLYPVLLLMILSFSAKSQTTASSKSGGIIYSAGVETGISSGNFNNAYRWNVGGSVQADIPVASQFYATVNAGYLNFNGKDNVEGTGLSAPNIRLVPVMAGLKFFPVSNFYIQADAGAGFALNKTDVGFTKTAAFLYTPQIGIQLPVGGGSYVDAGIRYEATTKFVSDVEDSKINFFGLRVAYAFGL